MKRRVVGAVLALTVVALTGCGEDTPSDELAGDMNPTEVAA